MHEDAGFHEKWYSYPVNYASCHINFFVAPFINYQNKLICYFTDWFVDGIHPNADGDAAIAKAVFSGLNV